MLRKAFLLGIKPGALDEYVEHHRTLREEWPELAAELKASGIATITIFERDPDLFLFSEVHDDDAWDRFWSSEPYAPWSAIMAGLMRYGPDGELDAHPLHEVWRFEAG